MPDLFNKYYDSLASHSIKVNTSIYAILKGIKNYHGFSSLDETMLYILRIYAKEIDDSSESETVSRYSTYEYETIINRILAKRNSEGRL
ncbi:hypothetical protein QNJ28_10515 [Macrococcus caseolyticus]|uniref:hypothetical protein n=1 Tax=Macrococcoides caseolyticum TaxID=69966 RepID=UPI0024BC018A|nr:hypothetical protein [Macrococcus caseolyticus]MDJ1110489.1 hypothetical protein [Macrococcus caseolyticus]